MSQSARDLGNWVPADAFWEGDCLTIDWLFLGEQRPDPAGFEDTVARAARRPFNRLFRHATPVGALEAEAARPHVAPSGFVFHMSRCGSTLLARLLGGLDGSLVVSEAHVIDAILRAGEGRSDLSAENQADWLKWMLAVLGRQRQGERRFFVKFDAWHTLSLPLVRRVFPGVPWIFLYREPLEVLVSLMRSPALHVLPGFIPLPSGNGDAELAPSREHYASMVLAEICRAAMREAATATGGRLLNYRDLIADPEPALRHFGVTPSTAERQRLAEIVRVDAKRPHLPFSGDGAAKQAAATPMEAAAAEKWLGPIYREIEKLRMRPPSTRFNAEAGTGSTDQPRPVASDS